jgi:hypothetical protein
MKRWLLLLALAACGPSKPELAGPCAATCECKRTDAPLKCPGEWVCNGDKLCEYTCKSTCSGGVSTCPSGSECNGSLCSERKSCG